MPVRPNLTLSKKGCMLQPSTFWLFCFVLFSRREENRKKEKKVIKNKEGCGEVCAVFGITFTLTDCIKRHRFYDYTHIVCI